MKRVTLGIIANEFFEKSAGRMGGFGWVARAVAQTFLENPTLGIDPVFLTRERQAGTPVEVGGVPLVAPAGNKMDYVRRLANQRVDVMITIDYRPTYRLLIMTRPRTPLILWVHDPRTPFDLERLASLRVPGQETVMAQGVEPIDARGFASIVRTSRMLGRPIQTATHARYLRDKVEGTYGFTPPRLHFLPDPLFLPRGIVRKADRPRVLFLARLDPYKRPWLFVELARAFPEVEFVMLGQAHFSGAGAWTATDLPPNVVMKGHVDGDEKLHLLRTSWLLVNTSIHEALPISFLEALAFETPIVAAQDPDEVVSRFGTYVPRTSGTGMEALLHFTRAMRDLLSDHTKREELGARGRTWVESTHNRQTFAVSLQGILTSFGLAVGDARSIEEHPGVPS